MLEGFYMKHYLITKINIELNYFKEFWSKITNSRFDNSYLSHRLEMFDKYVLPSVESQVCNDFVWLVFIHPQTPVKIKEEFKARVDNLIEVVHEKDISRSIDNFSGDIITTNLDSDDMISNLYIKKIHEIYRSVQADISKPFIISFKSGFLFSENKQILYPFVHPENNYLSFIEDGIDFTTITSYRHVGKIEGIRKLFPMIEVEEGFWWIINNHNKNLVNNFKQPTRNSKVLKVEDIYSKNVCSKVVPYYRYLRNFIWEE